MNKIIRKVFLMIVVLMLSFSCGVKKQVSSNAPLLGLSMRVTCHITNGKMYQIDSIIKADTLPSYNKWLFSVYTDYETNVKMQKRMYIKKVSNGGEIVYIVSGSQEPYKITKRITE